MRYIIMCAGNSSRWDNYMGVPKQLIDIHGEPLLYRTIRLLQERNQNDIIVITPSIDFYGKLPVKQVIGINNTDIDKLLNTKDYIIDNTILICGDVLFTEKAIDTIISLNSIPPLFIGRKELNMYSKKTNEIFAVYVNRSIIDIFDRIKLSNEPGCWTLYNTLIKKKNSNRKVKRQFVHINDATNDFDYPFEYDTFVKNKGLDDLI